MTPRRIPSKSKQRNPLSNNAFHAPKPLVAQQVSAFQCTRGSVDFACSVRRVCGREALPHVFPCRTTHLVSTRVCLCRNAFRMSLCHNASHAYALVKQPRTHLCMSLHTQRPSKLLRPCALTIVCTLLAAAFVPTPLEPCGKGCHTGHGAIARQRGNERPLRPIPMRRTITRWTRLRDIPPAPSPLARRIAPN